MREWRNQDKSIEINGETISSIDKIKEVAFNHFKYLYIKQG